MEKQLGRTPEALVGPEFPELLSHLWSIFVDLNSCRSEKVPLTYTEIKAYLDVTQEPMTTKEIAVIKELDGIWLKVMHSE